MVSILILKEEVSAMSETVFYNNNILNRKRSRTVNHQVVIQKTIDAIRHPQPLLISHKQK
jgi:hypothetical protein